jgi:hypothetical protein
VDRFLNNNNTVMLDEWTYQLNSKQAFDKWTMIDDGKVSDN